MRKSSLLLLGAVFGAGATTLGLETHFLASEPAQAASAGDTYRQLNLFGDAFEHIRSYYVEKPDDAKLVEAAIN
ncbi:MAG: peptidase S41, partial [Beijerinckiaceae bacterium]